MRKVRLWIALAAALVVTAASAQSQVTVTAAEYFFDTDPGYGQATAISSVVAGEQTFDLSTGTLSAGVHTLCLRSLGSNGVWSATTTRPIYVLTAGSSTASIEYFFDTDPGYGRGNVVAVNGSQDVALDISTADLTPGAHMLYLRSLDTNGHWSAVMAHPLYVFTTLPVAALEYFLDSDDPGEGLATAVPVATATAATATFDIDTSVLSPGEHTLNIRAMGIDSVWTAVSTRTFTVAAPAVVEPEPYAVLSDDGLTVTFYYDDQKANRSGVVEINTNGFNSYTETSTYGSATLAVIDPSFANYHPTSTAYWFMRCSSLTAIDGIENLNTEDVTDMSNMFSGCSSLTSLDVRGFNTEKVDNMDSMFLECSSLTSLDVSGFKTDNVKFMSAIFYVCSSLTSLDVSGFNTANVTDMAAMFDGCSSLTSLDLSGFKTDNVTYMDFMFDGCSSLTSLDLSSFKTDNVTDMVMMFYGCSSLSTIYAGSGWSIANDISSREMFDGCTNLVGGMGTTYDENHTDAAYAHIDGGPSNPGYLTDKNAAPVVEPEPYAVLSDDNTVLTFYYDEQKEERGGLSVGPFDIYADNNPSWYDERETITSVVFDPSFADCTTLTSTAFWFWGCTSLTSLSGLENLRTDNVTDMHAMFWGCSGMASLDLSSLNTSSVTNMEGMFYFCRNLSSLNVSGFNTANVTNMSYMFCWCPSLTSLDVSHFDTRSATTIRFMFNECAGLISLDLSHFDTSNVTETEAIFQGCTSLASIQAGSADIPAEEYERVDNPNLLVYVNDASLAPAGVQNVVIDGVAQEIVLTDATGSTGNNNFYVPQAFTAERISYTRSFQQLTQVGICRGWEALTLPFTVQSIAHETKGTITPFGGSDEYHHFWLRRLSADGAVRATQIEANVPYIISMPNDHSHYLDSYCFNGRVTFSAAGIIVPETENTVLALADSSIVMRPALQRVSRSSGVWALNVGEERDQFLEGSVFERDYRDVRPFEAYTVHSGQNAPRFVLIEEMPGFTTGIETVELSEGCDNIATAGTWYDLQGRKIETPKAANGQLTKGVYIVNGRKVVR